MALLNCKNVGLLIKRNSKIICLYDMLRARTFRARRKSLLARNAHAYGRYAHANERACNFFRSSFEAFVKKNYCRF